MKLSINGGKKGRTKNFPSQLDSMREERKACKRIFKRRIFSMFRGNWIPQFWGGAEVRALEKHVSDRFDTHALAVNSCTSALIIACGAIGLKPGDEVIVSPYSMCCSATAPLHYGAIPVFADVEPEYFCLDPEDVKRKITPKTKAIIVVDLFGQPYAKEIDEIAKEYGLYVIEDAAQALGAKREGKYAGTLGHIGCYSFTQGKHLTAGEGGMIVTNDSELLIKCALIRNHAESVIHGMHGFDRAKYGMYENMLGYNMRMTEIQAAMLIEQFKKLDRIIKMRRENAYSIMHGLKWNIPFITTYPTRQACEHSYYVLPFKVIGTSGLRDAFINAVKAELTEETGRIDRGVPIGCGYIEPLYRLPLFQNRMHWSIKGCDYSKVFLPVVERLYREELFLTLYHGLRLQKRDIQDICAAFRKVAENIGELK
jgi:dTDP-4-amino-4,6-dideoxygalactose transaminase